MAQLVKQFGPILHLFVGKFDAQCPYCIWRSGIGETRKAKVNEVGADSFFFKRLAKKNTENKAKLRGVQLLQTAVYKLVVLGVIVLLALGQGAQLIDFGLGKAVSEPFYLKLRCPDYYTN